MISHAWKTGLALTVAAACALAGCCRTLMDVSEEAQGPAPLRMRSPSKESCCYEDNLTGGQVFDMYCSYCHNAPSLAERPYAQFRNVAAHMRVRANLTGKEYAKLMEFLRRWNDVPPPTPPLETTPKRFIFSQPIAELRPKQPAPGGAQPAPGTTPAAVTPAAAEQPQAGGQRSPGYTRALRN
jgi:hypothetical protein